MNKVFSIKKIFLTFLLCMTLLIGGVLLTACGGGSEEEATTYTITLPEQSDIYTISTDKETAQEGETVTLTVQLYNTDDYKLNQVQYNNKDCTKVDNTTYTFTMPASDVEIIVSITQYEEVTSNNSASFRIIPDKIAKAQESDTSWAKDKFYIDFESTVINPTVTITSSNEDVIPVDAIAYTSDSGESYVNYLYFTIDLSKVDVGVSYLTFNIRSSNTGYSATLTKKIEVVNYGEDLYDEVWTASVTLDLSKVISLGYDIYIQVYDEYKQYGTDIGKVKTESTTESSYTITFDYVPNRQYIISAYYYADPTDNHITSLKITNTIGTGTSETGFNQCIDGYLTFIYDNANLSITVTQ